MTSALAIFTTLAVPFFVAFTPDLTTSTEIVTVELIIDVVYLADIFLNFRTSFISRHTGDEIVNPTKIATNYLVSGKFLLDLLAALPLDYIVYAWDPHTYAWRVLALLRLIRVHRLQKMLVLLRARDEVKLIFKFIELLLFLLMYVHVVGCIWFMLVDTSQTWCLPLTS
jgi:hypothetical protein